MKNVFQGAVAAVGSGLSYIFGGWDALLGILIAFVAIDYISGILAAGYHGKLNSAVGLKGISKKIGIFVLVAIANLVDTAMGNVGLVRDAAIFFYLANELLSITENVGALGVPIPQVLLNAVEVFKGKAENMK